MLSHLIRFLVIFLDFRTILHARFVYNPFFIKELTMARFVKAFPIAYDDLRFSRTGGKILSIDK